MKEFIKNNKITYNLMSFTAFKTLLIFSLLLEAPRSYEDIIEYFKNHDYINETISVDTARVYINSLRMAGCVIEKTKRAEGSKFVLISHPFELEIPPEQIRVFTKIYKTLSKNISIEELIMLEKFLRKLCGSIKNPEFQQALEKASPLTGYDVAMLEDLLKYCKNKNQIVLDYNSPRSGIKALEIICDKMDFENSKLYIYGTSIDYEQSAYLQVNRIVNIREIKLHKDKDLNIKEIKVLFEVNANSQELQLRENEKIISVNNEKTLIEAKSSNQFALKQRILSFGSACKVLEPAEFRDEIVTILRNMRAEYQS